MHFPFLSEIKSVYNTNVYNKYKLLMENIFSTFRNCRNFFHLKIDKKTKIGKNLFPTLITFSLMVFVRAATTTLLPHQKTDDALILKNQLFSTSTPHLIFSFP